jgi:hypothetical protein
MGSRSAHFVAASESTNTKSRRIFKCKGCEKQFSLTSRTIFADRKMSYSDIIGAIAIFVNGVNGHAALRITRDLGCSYKTAFVLEHKLREVFRAIRPLQDARSARNLPPLRPIWPYIRGISGKRAQLVLSDSVPASPVAVPLGKRAPCR